MKVQSHSKLLSNQPHTEHLNESTQLNTGSIATHVPQAKMRTEDLDNIEETLRNDLRRDGQRHVISSNGNQDKIALKNSMAHRHNYNACDQSQAGSFRSIPNITENFRPHHVGHSSSIKSSSISLLSESNQETPRSNVEDFKRYCSLLTERIQKVEEQNMQLLRIAERQRMEYDKVVAQVVESEQSQRQLINECSHLRHQVQQLASHNKKLTSQHDDSCQSHGLSFANQNSSFSYEGESRANANVKQVFDVLKHLQLKPAANLESNSPADLSSAVEPCAAAQLTSECNRHVSETPEVSKSPHHAVSKGSSELGVILESPVCVNQKSFCDISTTALAEGNVTHISQTDEIITSTSCKSTPKHSIYQRQRNLLTGYHQPFNNNPQNSSNNLQHRFCPNQVLENRNSSGLLGNLRGDSRLRRSHTHLNTSPIKIRERQRPSSLVMDVEFSHYGRLNDNGIDSQQVYNVPARSLSPASPPTSPTHFKQAPTRNKCAKHNLSTLAGSCSELSNRDANANVWVQKKSASSSSLLEDPNSQITKKGFYEEPKQVLPDSNNSFKKIDSNVGVTPRSANDSRLKNDENNSSQLKINEGLPNKPSLRKNVITADQSPSSKLECKKDNSALARRRHSYGRACRKSQSLDLLGEPLVVSKSSPTGLIENPDSNKDNVATDNDLPTMSLLSNDSSNVGNLNDSGFASPSVNSYQNGTFESTVVPCPKNKQERPRPPKPIRSHLKKKVLVNESLQTNTDHTETQSQDKSNQSVTENQNNVVIEKKHLNESKIMPSGRSFRTRRYSEGSAGSRKREKLLSDSEKRRIKRQTSVGNDIRLKGKTQSFSHSFKADTEDSIDGRNMNLETNASSQPTSISSDNSKITTKSHDTLSAINMLQLHDKKEEIDPHTISNLKTVGKNRSLTEPPEVSSLITENSIAPKSPAQESLKNLSDDFNKQNRSKLSKRDKSSPLISRESKKNASPGGHQGKSLVHLVKSKFTRSSSSAKLSPSTKKKQLEPSKRTDGPIIVPDSTSSMKPGLSLEDVSYLPPGKDGDSARMSAKQKISEIVPDQITSRTIESCASLDTDDDLSKGHERKTSDELLSDEGFADSSTIERSETEEYQQLPDDIELLRSKMFALPCSNNEAKTNTVSSTESENSVCSSFEQIEKTNRYNLATSFDESKNDDKKSHQNRDFDAEVYATEVTLVPTSALQRPNHMAHPSSKLKAKKIQKPSSFGRFMKTVSNHSSGSKEDLSQNKELSTKHNQGKDLKKGKMSGYQRDIEQAFMSSIVQAELKQGLREGNQLSTEDSKDLKRSDLPYPLTNADSGKTVGSIGSGSSVSSIPSVGFSSTNSGDSLTSDSSTAPQPNNSPKVEKSLSSKLPGFESPASKKFSKGSMTPPLNSKLRLKNSKSLKESAFIPAPELEALKTSNVAKPLSESRIRASSMGSKVALSSQKKSSPIFSASSKLTKPSKLSPAGKSKIKTSEKSSSTPQSNQTPVKTRLAPLNYGFSPILDKTSQQSKKNSKPSLRIPLPRSAPKSVTVPVEVPQARSGIPASGLFRPKPVYNGM